MSDIEFYTLQRSGNAQKSRVTSSLFSQTKSIMVLDKIHRKIWVFHGEKTHSETLRLAPFAVKEMNFDFNYEIEEVTPNDYEEKKNFLVDLFKNPEKADSIKVRAIAKSKAPSQTKSSQAFHPFALGMNYKPQARAEEPIIESKAEEKKVKPETSIPVRKSRTELEAARAIPKPVADKPTATPQIFQPKGDMPYDQSIERTIEAFQINYYEKTGGSNFILVEEISKMVERAEQFDALISFVKSLNKHLEQGTEKEKMRDVLYREIDALVDLL